MKEGRGEGWMGVVMRNVTLENFRLDSLILWELGYPYQ
jgi:hypothetical protein